MKHTLTHIIRSSILFIFSSSILAFEGNFYLGGLVGSSTAELGEDNPTINYYDNQIRDRYPLNDNEDTGAIFGINGGYEFEQEGRIPAIALGLGFYETTKFDFDGKLVETVRGSESNTLYHYKFNVETTRLMAEAKFTWALEQWTPFVDIGIGSAWNRIKNYKETAVTHNGYVPLPPFQSQTDQNFAYQLGLGIGYAFNFVDNDDDDDDFQHNRISLGYRYVNLGDVGFGTRGENYPHDLKFDDLSTNDFYIAYTHLF